jgi:DNA polymerase-3 subunit gamma/tau
MNQCDINYRQSNNKRLLVELTLIEIAQITQPDDDSASAGRRPRRLKSLFKNLIRQSQPQKAAPQVAAAEPVVSPQEPNESTKTSVPSTTSAPETTSTPITTNAPSNPNPTPSHSPTKLGGIGFSWNNLRGDGKPSKINFKPGTVGTSNEQPSEVTFSQEDLELQWMAMCNRMPQEYSGIATRMKNMNPVITEFPQIEVVVDNALIKQEMEDFKGRIVKTLQNALCNNSLSLDIRIAEKQERIVTLTRREQFDLMSKENPAVDKLRQAFELELA